jgi:hypothetical protein
MLHIMMMEDEKGEGRASSEAAQKQNRFSLKSSTSFAFIETFLQHFLLRLRRGAESEEGVRSAKGNGTKKKRRKLFCALALSSKALLDRLP